MGGSDAAWYARILADFASQWRHGSIPVWIGQSEYAFNGGANPVRIEPLLQHIAGIVSVVGRSSFAPNALKNASICVVGLLLLYSAYFSLRFVLFKAALVRGAFGSPLVSLSGSGGAIVCSGDLFYERCSHFRADRFCGSVVGMERR